MNGYDDAMNDVAGQVADAFQDEIEKLKREVEKWKRESKYYEELANELCRTIAEG